MSLTLPSVALALRLLLALAWSVLLCILLLQGEADPLLDLGLPRGESGPLRELAFSALHLLAFTATGLCWHWASPRHWHLRRRLLWASLITGALGISTELLQSFTADRHFSWLDLLANAAGTALAAWLARRYRAVAGILPDD